jgi:hypothetical protein
VQVERWQQCLLEGQWLRMQGAMVSIRWRFCADGEFTAEDVSRLIMADGQYWHCENVYRDVSEYQALNCVLSHKLEDRDN